jgi:hypothetical protein
MARTMTSLYDSHRKWALSLAEQRDDSDEGRLTALVVLWKCCREYEDGGFRDFAKPRIEEALGRKEAEV